MSEHANSIKPLFTIITATYNAENFLKSTIESISSQKFHSYEWIIVDACSTDSTPKLIEDNLSVFSLYISEKDDGIYDAWNKGLSHSKGDWIIFIGAGDQLVNDALENYANLIHSLKINDECNFISSKAEIVDKNYLSKKIIGREFVASEFIKYMSISHVGAMHHKSLFNEFGLFSKTFRSSSDYEFLLRCKDFIKPLFLNKITVKMLSGGMSESYKAVYETYLIHKKYHKPSIAKFYFFIAVIKLFIRKNLSKI